MDTLSDNIRPDPLDEWVYWAHELVEYKPEATFWDLLRLMYYIKTGILLEDKDENTRH